MMQSSEDGDGEGEGEGEREGERGGDRMCEDTEKPSSTNLPRLHIRSTMNNLQYSNLQPFQHTIFFSTVSMYRLYNYEPITSLKNVKAPLYGKVYTHTNPINIVYSYYIIRSIRSTRYIINIYVKSWKYR